MLLPAAAAASVIRSHESRLRLSDFPSVFEGAPIMIQSALLGSRWWFIASSSSSSSTGACVPSSISSGNAVAKSPSLRSPATDFSRRAIHSACMSQAFGSGFCVDWLVVGSSLRGIFGDSSDSSEHAARSSVCRFAASSQGLRCCDLLRALVCLLLLLYR